MHLLEPHDKVHNIAAKTRKRIGLIITNSQNMYTCFFKVVYAIWTHMFIISSSFNSRRRQWNCK